MATSSIPLAEGWVAIVDDDPSIRRSLSRVFRVNGISARAFESAEEFLISALIEEPRCLVVDVNLGGMSGFALQDRLAELGRAPPIVFMTAMDEIASHHLEDRSGSNGYLRKPFETTLLLALVRKHLSVPAEAAKQ